MSQTSARRTGSACFPKIEGRLTRLLICFTILFSLLFAPPARGFTCDALKEHNTFHPAGCEADFAVPAFNEVVPTFAIDQDPDNSEAAQALAEGRQLARQKTKEAHLQAVTKYEEALRLFRMSGDRVGQAATLLSLASSYSFLKETRKEVESYEQALPLMDDPNFNSVLPTVLYRVGVAHSSLGDQRKALEYLNRALPMVQDESKRTELAAILSAVGMAHTHLGERRKAVGYFEQALEIFQATGGGAAADAMLGLLASLYAKLGDKQKALDLTEQALRINRASGNKRGEGNNLLGLGSLYSSLGHQQKALEQFNLALDTFREADDRLGMASTLNNIGLLHNQLGYRQKALDYLQEALRLSQSIDGPKGGAASLSNIGSVYASTHEYHKALDFYLKALESVRATPNVAGEASVAANIGNIYLLLYEHRKALEHLQRALQLFRLLGDRNDEAVTLNLLGMTYHSLGDKQKALEYYGLALALGRAIPDRRAQAIALGESARVEAASGERQKAIVLYDEARLLFHDIGERDDEATILSRLGMLHELAGESRKALEYFEQALAMQQDIIDRKGEAATLSYLGLFYEKRGNLRKAADYYERSVNVEEKVRTAARLEEFKTRLAEKSADVYARAVLINVRLGRASRAFDFSERARARTFLDQLGNTRIDVLKDANEQVVQKEQALRFELSALEAQLGRERAQPESDSNAETLTSLGKQLQAKRAEYEDLFTDLKLRAPEYASILSINTSGPAEIQKQLDAQTTLLSYFATSDGTVAFVITKDSLRAVSLPVQVQTLDAEIASFRGFADLDTPHPQSLRNLHRLLILPLRRYLKTQRVGIIPHGTLHYLPFAALTDGQRYFGDEHEIFYLPSASVLPFLRQKRKPPAHRLLALAQSQADGLPVLKYADKSAKDVATLYNTTALGTGDATEAALRARAPQSDLVFLAAHGRLDNSNPLFSHIVLAPAGNNDGLLEVHEVYGLDLKNVSLIVLSGCQTQLGGRSPGDDIIGLNRAFIYAGTPAVAASLWSVKEQQTGELMVSFFKNLKGGMSPARALQAAQREIRKTHPHPYYWAAFVLTGDGGTPSN